MDQSRAKAVHVRVNLEEKSCFRFFYEEFLLEIQIFNLHLSFHRLKFFVLNLFDGCLRFIGEKLSILNRTPATGRPSGAAEVAIGEL